MSTQAEYDAGTAAAVAVIAADIATEVPRIFQARATPQLIHQHAQAVAKAVIDAAAVVRAKAQQQT